MLDLTVFLSYGVTTRQCRPVSEWIILALSPLKEWNEEVVHILIVHALTSFRETVRNGFIGVKAFGEKLARVEA